MIRLLMQRGAHPQTATHMLIGYFGRKPMQRRMISLDSEPEQQEGSVGRFRSLDHVPVLDDRVADLTKDLGNFKADVNKSIGVLTTNVGVGFSQVETRFAVVDGKLVFLQWQLGLVLSAVFAFCGFTGYTMKRVADAYIPLVVAADSLEAAAGRKEPGGGEVGSARND